MTRRLITNEDYGDRSFIGVKREQKRISRVGLNLEYVINFENNGEHNVKRTGHVLPETTEEFKYCIGGTIYLKPKLENILERDLERDYVKIFYKKGQTMGAVVKPKDDEDDKAFAVVHIEGDELTNFVEKYFPRMKMYGKTEFATVESLPGDTPKDVFQGFLMKALESDLEFIRLSKAHCGFVEAYLKNDEVKYK